VKEIRLLEQNIALISGYLARDPDFRATPSGTPLCRFTVGVSRRMKDKTTGDWKDDTSWVPVTVWGDAAERLRDRLKKGSPVHIEGRLKSSSYDDKATGKKIYSLEVVANRVQFLAKSGAGAAAGAPSSPEEPAPPTGPDDKTDLEEVPF
jgi:single-strand DNA-binding protein